MEKKLKVRLESLQEFPSCMRCLSPETRAWQNDKMWCQVLLPIQRPSLRYQVPCLSFEVNQTPPLRLTWAEGYIYPKIRSGRAVVIWARIKVPLCTPEKHLPSWSSFSMIQMNVEWVSGDNSCCAEELAVRNTLSWKFSSFQGLLLLIVMAAGEH